MDGSQTAVAVESDQQDEIVGPVRPDGPPGIKPWTIKGIPPEIRNAAIAAADRDGQTIGEWFTRGIPAIIQHNRRQNRLPVAVESRVDQPVRPSDPAAALAEMERITALLKDLRQIDANIPPPKTLVRLAYRMALARARVIVPSGRTSRAGKSDPAAGEVAGETSGSPQSDQGTIKVGPSTPEHPLATTLDAVAG